MGVHACVRPCACVYDHIILLNWSHTTTLVAHPTLLIRWFSYRSLEYCIKTRAGLLSDIGVLKTTNEWGLTMDYHIAYISQRGEY